jgi:hypothetical protein
VLALAMRTPERTIRKEETDAQPLKPRERNQRAKRDRKDKAPKATVSHDQKIDHSVGVPWRRYSEIRGYGRVVYTSVSHSLRPEVFVLSAADGSSAYASEEADFGPPSSLVDESSGADLSQRLLNLSPGR